MNSKIPTEHLYFFLWCIYYLQGSLYPSGGVISQSVLLILFVFSAIHVYKIHTNRLPKTLKCIDVFIALVIIYGVIGFISGYTSFAGTTNIGIIKGVLISFFPVYSVYYYSIKGRITLTTIAWWTVFLFLVYILYYNTALTRRLARSVKDVEEATNNAGYLIASMVPLFFFLYKKPILQYVGLAVIMLMTLYSMKRGAILICSLSLILFVLKTMKTKNIWRNLTIIVFLVVIVYLAYFNIGKLLDSSDFFNRRIEQTMEGNSSNRDIIYSTFYNAFITEDNPFRFVFGYGAFATGRLFGGFAHNDWLELAIDNGIIGVLIYLLYWISLIKDWIKSRKIDYLSNTYTLVLIYLFWRSLVSMSYLMIPLSISIVLGFSIARSKMGFPDYLKCNR